jgi:hypothetical protein
MSEKGLNALIPNYKKTLANGEIQKAYQSLVGIVQNIRTDFSKTFEDQYTVANVLHGYIDFTYFYLQNDYLKNRKLKFAIVFNHQQAYFELWLLGQTKNVQVNNWKKLKGSKWVTSEVMPKYSIFDIVLLPSPDFENYKKLSKSINTAFDSVSKEIFKTLEKYEQ